MVQERPVRVERRLSAILAADVASYSRLMHNDEEPTHAKLTELLKDSFNPAIAKHGGRVVSIRCGHLFHQRSKSNDDFGYSLTLVNGTTERPLDFFQIPRLSAQPDQPGLCTKDRRRDSVGDRVGFRIAAAHEFRAGPQWHLAPRVAHTFLRPEEVLIN